ncbi:efflux RND transporter periplasmic adaptor subunit [Ideonella sp. 4Y11]|uniref:Efflux RND transporter periplasmic adaptor subunit n=1 Tax=Ideonella aquatica TaxID=2824119 RepID=A0A941BJD2_9BURK|nr:efflux RND transporter periplasmic adaptor subunit [Ideonella aquatica]MBQ0957344.1 efflux RND transporter periplasmic adaptor subunit [Ideonella aquatica]
MPTTAYPLWTPVLTRALPRAALTLLVAALVACGGSGGGAPGGGQMPPSPVGVVTATRQPLALSTELPGRLEALRSAQVRARVTGVVQKRLFAEGGQVKAGQSLFQIDAAPYQAALDSARATEAKAEAALANAQATLERNRPLVEAKAISQQEWISTQTAHKQAQADLAAARAARQTAALNVEYAQVRSPITGRIGRATVSEGQLVSQTEATLMATVQQVDTLYVNFTQSAAEALRLKRAFDSGALKASGSNAVRVVLDDGSEYPLAGKLLFTDLTVDATSGQVSLRAEVPNPKGQLLPGLYVKVRIEQAATDHAILLPQQAVQRSAAGDTVMLVGADGQVAVRPVKLGGSRGAQWVVTDGLQGGEQVIVDGFQKIRPKAPVKPVPWSPAGSASAAAASAPASAASR